MITIQDIKYFLENKFIQVKCRSRDKSLRMPNGKYLNTATIKDEYMYDNFSYSIVISAKYHDHNGVSNWKEINVEKTKDSVKNFIKTQDKLYSLKVELPETNDLRKIICHIFKNQYDCECGILSFSPPFGILESNKFSNFRKGYKDYISLLLEDDDGSLAEHLNCSQVLKNNYIKDTYNILEFVLWCDSYGLFSKDIKDWKKLKMYLFGSIYRKTICFASNSKWSCQAFINFIEALEMLGQI